MTPTPGETAERPMYMRLVRTDDQIDWKKIVLMLALTAVSGYIATQSQRAGSNPDFLRIAKMRTALGVKHFADAQSNAWAEVATKAANVYHAARI